LRVLIVTSRFPFPPWRGNQVRTVEWLEALSDHDRIVLCPDPEDQDRSGEVADGSVSIRRFRLRTPAGVLGIAASVAGGRPVQEGLYATGSARRALRELLGDHRPDVAVVQMVRCGWAVEAIRQHSPDTAILFDAIDAMGLHFGRAASFVGPMLKPAYALEAELCRRRERWLSGQAELTTAVSARDLAALGSVDGSVVPVAGRVGLVERLESRPPFVLLSGNLGYRPTVQSATWFAERVWPEIRQSLPGLRWVLAGARPAAAIRRLSGLDGVEVQGDVPDLARIQAAAALAIAPMREGSGVPMKVLEAWAAGVPVVAHPWTAEGLDASCRDGVVVADGASEWRRAIVQLMTDRTSAARLAARGDECWKSRYSPDHIREQIRGAVRRAAASR
jgi:hypothetical protein